MSVRGSMGFPALGTLLVHAFDVLYRLVGGDHEMIATIFAARAGHRATPYPALANVNHASVAGDLHAMVTLADTRPVTLNISDRSAGDWFALEMVGAQGTCTLSPRGVRWYAPDGSSRASIDLTSECGERDLSLARAVVASIAPAPANMADQGPLLLERSLLAAHAALLSATTGQPESPANIQRLAAQM
jgi:hypothetical protein